MHWKIVLTLGSVVTLYLLLGGVIFHFLERPTEEQNQAQAISVNAEFLGNFTCVTKEQFQSLVAHIIKAYNQGIIATNESLDTTSNWDYVSSVFFSTTVITTIGYGHISPVTNAGRILCVIYAVIGIPLAGALLAGIGENIAESAKARFKPKDSKSKCARSSRAWMTVIFVTSGLVIFIFLPSILFALMENWTYSEALYYAAITLTTIGFGDFVAGRVQNPPRPGLRSTGSTRIWYRLLISVWIPVGLSWCALLISEFTDIVKAVFTKKKSVEHEDDTDDANNVDGKHNNGFTPDHDSTTELQDVKTK